MFYGEVGLVLGPAVYPLPRVKIPGARATLRIRETRIAWQRASGREEEISSADNSFVRVSTRLGDSRHELRYLEDNIKGLPGSDDGIYDDCL